MFYDSQRRNLRETIFTNIWLIFDTQVVYKDIFDSLGTKTF